MYISPLTISIDTEIHNPDKSSCADLPILGVNGAASVKPDQPTKAPDPVTQALQELNELRALCSMQQKELKEMAAELEEAREDLKETEETVKTQQKKLWLLNQAVECDRPARSKLIAHYKLTRNRASTPADIIDMLYWKANAVADALLYLENVRDDPAVFKSLYGMSWGEVLKIETAETLRVLNAFARSRAVKNTTRDFRNAAGVFFREYSGSSRELRLGYPSQTSSPLRIAYNGFWLEHKKLLWRGHHLLTVG